ncbi:MAG: TonB-dependent receptor plug domain-containing protein [bacterium]
MEKNLTSSKQVVGSEIIDDLPVSTLDEVIESVPGVVSHQGKLHLRGGRAGEELLLIDGASIRDGLFNETIAPVNPNAIAELQVITGTFNADYGNALSGVFNTVLKEGDDKWAGSLTYRTSLGGLDNFKGEDIFEDQDIYDDVLTSSTLATRKPFGEDRFQIAEGTLGGPLGDKLRFFVSGRYFDNPTSFPEFGIKQFNIQPKLTLRLSSTAKLSLQGMIFDTERPFDPSFDVNKVNGSDGRHNYWLWKYNLGAFPQTEESGYQVGLNWTHTLSPKTFYSIRVDRFSKEREDFSNDAGGNKIVYDSPAEPNHNLSVETEGGTIAYFGTDAEYGIYNLNKEKALTFDGSLTSQVSQTHQLKFGVQFTSFNIDRVGHDLWFGRAVDPNKVQTQAIDVSPYEGAAYIQDQMEFADMILNVGLRLDLFNVNADDGVWQGFNPFTSTRSSTESHVRLSPRLGFSHPLGEDRAVHYAYGTFFQRPRYYDLLENYLAQNDSGTESGFFIYMGNPALEPQITSQYEIGIQQAIGSDFKVDITGYYKDITNLIAMQEVFNASVTDPVTDQTFAHFFTKSSDHFGNVRGFEITIEKRTTNWIGGRLSYTFSSAKGTASGPVNEGAGIFKEVEGTVTENTLFLTTLDFARPHVLNGYIDIHSPIRSGTLQQFGANFLINIQSGLPITSRVGLAQAALGERAPANAQIDLRLDATLNLGAIRPNVFLLIENLLDRRNILSIKDPSSFFDETREGLFHNAAGPRNDLTAYDIPRTAHLGLTIGF